MGAFCLEAQLVTNTANSFIVDVLTSTCRSALNVPLVTPAASPNFFLTNLVELGPRWVGAFAPLAHPWLRASGFSIFASFIINLVIILKFLTRHLVKSVVFKHEKSHFHNGKNFLSYCSAKRKHLTDKRRTFVESFVQC